MSNELQQWTCPKCKHVGADNKGIPAPLCDKCDFEVRMKRSHNGVIMAHVKVKVKINLDIEFNVEQPLPHYLGGDIFRGMLLAGETERKISKATNGILDGVFSGPGFRLNNMDTSYQIEHVDVKEEE